MLGIDVSARWFPREAYNAPEAFAAAVRDWLGELGQLDERFGHFGRQRAKQAENAAQLPLDALEKARKRQQGNLFLDSARSPLDTGLDVLAHPGHVAAGQYGRAGLIVSHAVARESELLRRCVDTAIGSFAPDEVSVALAGMPRDQKGVPMWLLWKRDASGPGPVPDLKPRGTPAGIAPWLGGTLYTWPEHEPRKVLAQAAGDQASDDRG